MFTFEHKSEEGAGSVRFVLPDHFTWRELLESFVNFLRGCGYKVESADIMTPEAMLALEADWEAEASRAHEVPGTANYRGDYMP